MNTFNYLLKGNTPLLMHSDVTANPLNKYTKQLKEITSKRKKTDEDYEAIAEIEFIASCYWDEYKGYYMPSANIDACLLGSAKQFKLGTTIKQAALTIEDCPFIFKDKKLKPKELFLKEGYADYRTVKVQQSKTVRCRPIFMEWEIPISIMLDENKMNEKELDQIVENAGLYIGLGDYRPRYGRFLCEKK